MRGVHYFFWEMFPGMPVVHQKYEAIADFMDEVHREGLVLDSGVTVEVHHGQHPVMELSASVRPASQAEAAALGYEKAGAA